MSGERWTAFSNDELGLLARGLAVAEDRGALPEQEGWDLWFEILTERARRGDHDAARELELLSDLRDEDED
jgi:hypothetical protein